MITVLATAPELLDAALAFIRFCLQAVGCLIAVYVVTRVIMKAALVSIDQHYSRRIRNGAKKRSSQES